MQEAPNQRTFTVRCGHPRDGYVCPGVTQVEAGGKATCPKCGATLFGPVKVRKLRNKRENSCTS